MSYYGRKQEKGGVMSFIYCNNMYLEINNNKSFLVPCSAFSCVKFKVKIVLFLRYEVLCSMQCIFLCQIQD
jgi:hypothetical protein